ncbi:hypothetical protein OPQ81_005168 [Rhizoctonia solani]|nr:hypothetical protein OPQ81_005168 [Rhizoctonia solani]
MALALLPSDPSPIPKPTRPLEWGDVNVLHTTDIHGWISGHSKQVYPEMSWSGNFGDFYSFVKHMRDKADERGSDLLLVDTGDRRIGHGLTDHILDPTTDVNGQSVSLLYHDLGYDLVVPGNHDLENPGVVKYTMDALVKVWGDKYVTSNVMRTNGEALGVRFRRWTTPKGKQMLAFGVVPIKTDTPDQLKVVPIDIMVKQAWFTESIKPKVDAFILLGHVDPQKHTSADNITLIYEAIRQEHPLTPILIFTGHAHKRWCRTFPGNNNSTRSMLIESGQYFDTVGWMSVKLDDNTSPRDLNFNRRFLDNNIQTYKYHTGIDNDTEFHTDAGKNITRFIMRKLENSTTLSEIYGELDSDYYLDRQVWTEKEEDQHSLFTFYLDAVQTSLIDSNKTSNWLFFSNWGIVRGDIYRGPFRLSDLYTISPNASDDSAFLYTTVSRDIADQIVQKTRELGKSKAKNLPKPQLATHIAMEDEDDSQSYFSLRRRQAESDTYGWVTEDLCGNGGDDVIHTKIPRVDFDNTTDGLPVYFWRKRYEPNIQPKDKVHIIVTNRIGVKSVPRALELLRVPPEDCQLKPYREDVKQGDSPVVLSTVVDMSRRYAFAGSKWTKRRILLEADPPPPREQPNLIIHQALLSQHASASASGYDIAV